MHKVLGMVILCWDHMMKFSIDAIGRSLGCLCWVDGCLMWLFMRYIILRLSINMSHGVLSVG